MLGEACIYNRENRHNLDSISAGIISLSIKEELRYYVLGILKSRHFKEFVDLNTPQGSTIRHSKLIALEYKIPLPTRKNNPNPQAVEDLVGVLVQNIIDKEEQIKAKNAEIDHLIEEELYGNQKKSGFVYALPKISEIRQQGRLDTGLYTEEFKKIDNVIKCYDCGSESLEGLGYNINRGQNLQVSNIGESYYSNVYKKGFYRMFTNIEMQDNRTISGYRYLGNKNKLTTLPDSTIMLSADGMIVGRSFFYDAMPNTITNIHPWIITHQDIKYPIFKRVFVSLFLSYLKNIGYYEKIKDKSNGGGLKKNHLDLWIRIPLFPLHLQEQIARLYYNKIDKNSNLTLENYLQKEKARNREAGIFQLNIEIFALREKLENLVHKIVMEEKIEVEFE